MTAAAPAIPEPFADEDTFIGEATLLDCNGNQARAKLPDGRIVAVELAFAFGLIPAPGDVLAVIGREEHWYAIGMLHSEGAMQLQFHGDISLETDGQLDLIGQQGVELRGDVVEIHAGTLRTVADAVVEKADSLIQRVRGLASLRSGSKLEIVEGQHTIRAERAKLTTQEAVRINGKEIHLG